MPDRSSRHQARHFGPALVVLASLGIAEAAPPAGKPVFIHVQGLAPTSVGQNGFIVAGDFTEGGAFQWMPTSGVTLVGGGLGTGYISRDGKAMAGTVIDLEQDSASGQVGRGKVVAHARSARPERRPVSRVFELCHGDERRRARDRGRRLVRHRPGQSVRPLYGLPMGGVHRVRASADPGWRLHTGPGRVGGRPRRGRLRRRPERPAAGRQVGGRKA